MNKKIDFYYMLIIIGKMDNLEPEAVGINLDTMNMMKDQFDEKQREHNLMYSRCLDELEKVASSIEQLMDTNMIQNRLLKKIYEYIGQYADSDPELRKIVDTFDGLTQMDVTRFTAIERHEITCGMAGLMINLKRAKDQTNPDD